MSMDLRIAVLTIGVILIAAAVGVTLLRISGRRMVLAGAGPRLLMGLAGVALIVWAQLAAHRGAAPTSARVTATPATPAAPATPATPAAAAAAPSAPASAGVVPAHPDLIVLAGAELDGCRPPTRPADPPDGASATRARMVAADAQAQSFNRATNAYLACLDEAASDFDRQYGAVLSASARREVQAMEVRSHNAAVDLDHVVADKFNRQLHIFKARGNGS